MKPWHCRVCGAKGTTRDQVAVVFHACNPPRRRQPSIAVGSKTREERVTEMFAPLFDAVGEDETFRRLA
jgi:hypothetical protein